MYNDFFGFRESPFNVTPDPRIFYSNALYQRTYTNLLYGICERKGVVVLSGEAGTGKTTILRRLMKNLEHTVHFAFCPYTTLSFDDLLDFVCNDIDLPQKPQGRSRQIEALHTFLIAQRQQHQYFALIIDEAHNLQFSALTALSQLASFTAGDECLLPIALVGQGELEQHLNHPAAASLKQAVTISCQLDRLQESEVGPFIYHRLNAVGCDRQEIFPPDVVHYIAEYSQGIPRYINTICDNALLIARIQAKSSVTVEIIEEVANDLQLLAVDQLQEEKSPASQQSDNSPLVHILTQPVQQPPVAVFPIPRKKKGPSPSTARFFVRLEPQSMTWAGIGAVSMFLFFLFSRIFFSTTIKSDSGHGPALEPALAKIVPAPTATPLQPYPTLTPEPELPSLPMPADKQPVAAPLKQKTSPITIAAARSNPLATDLVQKKTNSEPHRNPFVAALPASKANNNRQQLTSTPRKTTTASITASNTRQDKSSLMPSSEERTLSTNTHPLLAHAATGNPRGAKVQPRSQTPINSKEEHSWTPLMTAVKHGRRAKVQALLKKGAKVNEQTVSGRTALMLAALAGHETILRDLLDKGATINAKNAEGWTALMYAAWNGHTDIVQTLVRNGAKVDTKNAIGGTALTHAVRNGHHDAARILRTGQTRSSIQNLPTQSAVVGASRYRYAHSLTLLKRSERR